MEREQDRSVGPDETETGSRARVPRHQVLTLIDASAGLL